MCITAMTNHIFISFSAVQIYELSLFTCIVHTIFCRLQFPNFLRWVFITEIINHLFISCSAVEIYHLSLCCFSDSQTCMPHSIQIWNSHKASNFSQRKRAILRLDSSSFVNNGEAFSSQHAAVHLQTYLSQSKASQSVNFTVFELF